jgi:hypothetical protein
MLDVWAPILFNCFKIGSCDRGYCKHVNEPSGSINDWEIPDKLGEYQYLHTLASSTCCRPSNPSRFVTSPPPQLVFGVTLPPLSPITSILVSTLWSLTRVYPRDHPTSCRISASTFPSHVGIPAMLPLLISRRMIFGSLNEASQSRSQVYRLEISN